jgi:Sulfotransferase family
MTLRSRAQDLFLTLPDGIQGRVLRRMGKFPDWADGTAPRAPSPPAGTVVGPPDFVGVGVPKCGTSWWFSLLLAHPDVYGPIRKELLYFNRVFVERERRFGVTDEDLEAYHQWFPRPPGKMTGEWTPSYLFAYRLPPILRKAAPTAKLLVLVRDPVERYQSDISRHMNRRHLRNVRYKGLARGFYSAELLPWEQEFDRSELLVIQYEACIAHPADQLAATYRFLGLDDSFRPPGIERPVNKTKSKRGLNPGFDRLLVQLYEPDVAALASRYPELDVRLWPHFAHLADEL